MWIETFLEKYFMSLPTPVRVGVYILLVCVYVYLLLTPHFINGDVVAMTGKTVIPYRGVEMRTMIEGRTLTFRTNESGGWSIPLVSRLPVDQRIAVKDMDGDGWYEVVLGKADIWGRFWNTDYRITIKTSPSGVGITPLVKIPGRGSTRFVAIDSVIGAAHAGELVLPEQTHTLKVDPAQKQDIEKNVYQAVAAKMGRPSRALKVLPLSGPGAPKYVDRVDIILKLEKDYELVIPDDHWQSFATDQQLADYIYRRKLLEKSNPTRYQVKQSYDWAHIEANTPRQERPTFQYSVPASKPGS